MNILMLVTYAKVCAKSHCKIFCNSSRGEKDKVDIRIWVGVKNWKDEICHGNKEASNHLSPKIYYICLVCVGFFGKVKRSDGHSHIVSDQESFFRKKNFMALTFIFSSKVLSQRQQEILVKLQWILKLPFSSSFERMKCLLPSVNTLWSTTSGVRDKWGR